MATTTSATRPTPSGGRNQMLIGRGWIQAVALVLIFGFFVMGILAYRTYTAAMPMPTKVVLADGETVFTGQDITRGQELFQARGLMEYGSIMGHGGYLGPDFTADYLRRSADFVEQRLRADGTQDPHGAVIAEFRTNRYNDATGVITYTPNQAAAYQSLVKHYTQFFGTDAKSNGLLPQVITDPNEIRELTAFFSWTAWASAAERPGHSYRYTNNWPMEPAVDNGPTADLIVWSGLSLIALLGGTGVLFAVYGRWSRKIGWHSEEAPSIAFRQPGEVGLTKSQRATAWFFFVVALLFLV
ncbi:MAG: nitric-oxide reductase large subunit, partial [Micrococcales bacterium]|nr:nitric-oxide reductase large subunit [Micrococcales bacterium]